jgi:hypothetical protein
MIVTGEGVTSPEPKRAWQAPILEEIDYTATEVGGPPVPPYDGGATYSIP